MMWHCQYHVVWVPRYRYRVLVGPVKEASSAETQAICGYAGCEVIELNVQRGPVHLTVMIPPRTADNLATIKHSGAAQPRPAPSGGWSRPPMGVDLGLRPRGGVFYLIADGEASFLLRRDDLL